MEVVLRPTTLVFRLSANPRSRREIGDRQIRGPEGVSRLVASPDEGRELAVADLGQGIKVMSLTEEDADPLEVVARLWLVLDDKMADFMISRLSHRLMTHPACPRST